MAVVMQPGQSTAEESLLQENTRVPDGKDDQLQQESSHEGQHEDRHEDDESQADAASDQLHG